jgi:hypothetical protein
MTLSLPASSDFNPESFYLKYLSISDQFVEISFGYEDDVALVATIPTSSHVDNSVYQLVPKTGYTVIVGKIVIGSLRNTILDPSKYGYYEFDLAGGGLDPDVVWLFPGGAITISAVDPNGVVHELGSDIQLVAGINTRWTVQRFQNIDHVRLDALSGFGLAPVRHSADPLQSDYSLPDPIRTINSISPIDHNFILRTDDCITATPIDNGLSLKNRCATPCCSCEQYAPIESLADTLKDSLDEVDRRILLVENDLAKLISSILGSKLQSKPCVTCD